MQAVDNVSLYRRQLVMTHASGCPRNPVPSKYLYPDKAFRPFPLGEHVRSVLVHGSTGVPYMLAVYGAERDLLNVITEAFGALTNQPTVGLIAICSETKIEKAFRRRFAANGWDEIQDIEYFRPPQSRGTSAQRSFALPITNHLENLFFDVHSAMRDVDGLHSDEALEELCKIIYTRSYEEEKSKGGSNYLLSSESFGTTEEYASAIRAFYKEAADYDLRVFRLKIPQYERSRGVFNQPFHLSSAALARCYRLLENFDLSGSQADVKGRAFQKVLGKSVRSGMGQYFTPNPICELMVQVIQPTLSDLILDPFCGSGHFLTECLRRVSRLEGEKTKLFHEFAFGKLHGIEKSERMVRVAMTDMRLNGDGHSNIRCTDALLDFANYPDIAPDSFDVVITNPPFGSLLGQDALASLGSFELADGRKNVPLEALGLERAIQFLRPGGRLGIVLPESVFSSDSYATTRGWLLRQIVPRVIIGLPHQTFCPFGANVKTSILFCRKLHPGEVDGFQHKVCMIRADNVGYDAAGRECKGTDLGIVADEARAFLAKEGW